MLQTADGAAEQITGLLQRMRELAVQGQNDTNSTSDLDNLNDEFAALATEIDRIAADTEFNGTSLMSGATAAVLTIGADETDIITVTIGDFSLDGGATGTASVDTLLVTEASIATLTTDTDAAMYITNSDGDVLTVTSAQIVTAGATSFDDATVAELASAINAAFTVQTDMDQMTALAVGNSITFTQDTPGSGQIVSVGGIADGLANSVGQIGTGVSRTSNGDSAAGTPMAANLSTYSTASNNLVEATGTIAALDAAITGVNTARADFGANISRLGFTIDNLQSAITNTASAKSAIMDADYAVETTELARTQIIAQASTAMLSQANQQAQSVLALLK
jgi:flagellin